MENKIKLSIIVPCYNCEDTIGPLMDSIIVNDLTKEELQVIIVDDKSTDNFLDIVKTYEDKLNIEYVETTRDVHCPGNTRNAGLPYVKGEWLTFIDNDDTFKPHIFKKVFQIIKENNIKYVIATQIERIDLDGRVETLPIERSDGWIHGKFYNVENVIKKFDIQFKPDMIGQEDIYFNSLVRASLLTMNERYYYNNDFPTYQWRENEKSFTKTVYSEDWNYTDKYMEDYIFATSAPFLDKYFAEMEEEPKNDFINVILTGFLYTYFYYEGCLNRVNMEMAFKNLIHIHNFKEKIMKVLGCNEADIINYIYSNPVTYEMIRDMTHYSNGPFIETQSFRDFVLNI